MKLSKPSISCIVAFLTGCSTPLMTVTERDIGAVLQPISQANVIDARALFRHIFCAVNEDHGRELPDYRNCDDALHRLADEDGAPQIPVDLVFRNKLQVYVIPGIFGECLIDQVSPFSHAIAHMDNAHGLKIKTVREIRGRASSRYNAEVIHNYFKGVEPEKDKKLLIVSYSKGTTDMLFYLGNRNDEYKQSYEKIDALISVAGVVNGTPLADDANSLIKSLAEKFPIEECPTQDDVGIDDLTRRQQFLRLATQELPPHIKYYSVVAYADRANISTILKPFHRRLSLMDVRNDSQVIYYDGVIPTSQFLGYANADHWAVALPFEREKPLSGFLNKNIGRLTDKNEYPREVLFESILRHVDMDL